MKNLPEWSSRPITVSYLLNPAFCGEIIRRFINKYQNPIYNNGAPFQIVFLVLPIILHKGIRESLPKTSSKNFITWIESNQLNKMLLPNLIQRTLPYTKECIMFLLMYEVVEINKLGCFVIRKKPRIIKKGNEVSECFKKAELLGKWFAKSGSSQSIFINLGIKP